MKTQNLASKNNSNSRKCLSDKKIIFNGHKKNNKSEKNKIKNSILLNNKNITKPLDSNNKFFDSLESFFDIQKSLDLLTVETCAIYFHEYNLTNLKNFQSNPKDLQSNFKVFDPNSQESQSKLKDLQSNLNHLESNSKDLKSDSQDSKSNSNHSKSNSKDFRSKSNCEDLLSNSEDFEANLKNFESNSSDFESNLKDFESYSSISYNLSYEEESEDNLKAKEHSSRDLFISEMSENIAGKVESNLDSKAQDGEQILNPVVIEEKKSNFIMSKTLDDEFKGDTKTAEENEEGDDEEKDKKKNLDSSEQDIEEEVPVEVKDSQKSTGLESLFRAKAELSKPFNKIISNLFSKKSDTATEAEENLSSDESEEEDLTALKDDKEDDKVVEKEVKAKDEESKKKKNIKEQLLSTLGLADLLKPPASSSDVTDSALIQEMTDAYKEAELIQKEIATLREEINNLKKKDFNDSNEKILAKKHREIMEKMQKVEETTQHLEKCLGLADPSSDIFKKVYEWTTQINTKKKEEEQRMEKERAEREKKKIEEWKTWEKLVPEEDRFDLPQKEYPEDLLPKIIICGNTEDKFPKIVVAENASKSLNKEMQLENLTGKLNEALTMQEKIVIGDSVLESPRYRLNDDMIDKDAAVDFLNKKISSLQAEMKFILRENTLLSGKVADLNKRFVTYPDKSASSFPLGSKRSQQCKCHTLNVNSAGDPTRLAGGGSMENTTCCQSFIINHLKKQSPLDSSSNFRKLCPAELEHKLISSEMNTKQLEQQLGNMEQEVKNMKEELENTQRERSQLDQQRKLLKCTGPCAPCSCVTASFPEPSQPRAGSSQLKLDQTQTIELFSKLPPCAGTCLDANDDNTVCPLQLLRELQEKYTRLQCDYNNKLLEILSLRNNSERMRQEIYDNKYTQDNVEQLKVLKSEQNLSSNSRENLNEKEEMFIINKQKFKEIQEELEDIKILLQDETSKADHYKNKFLIAQEEVEELKQQMELLKMDNARLNENIGVEVQKVKNQFQEKLAELDSLPDLLKQMQIKLKESYQMKGSDEVTASADVTKQEESNEVTEKEESNEITEQLDDEFIRGGRNTGGGDNLNDLDEKNSDKFTDKMHEIANSMLEEIREDSARQISRTRNRCDAVRQNMQKQIEAVEMQLARCRAIIRSTQRDRDEIRQKMQVQINHLNETFEIAQTHIKTLQGHVNYFSSYNHIFNTINQSTG